MGRFAPFSADVRGEAILILRSTKLLLLIIAGCEEGYQFSNQTS